MIMLPKLSADVTGSDAKLSQFHNPQPDMVGQRTTIDKHTSKLVDLTIGVHMRGFCNKLESILSS